jgi:HAD superfamily hydrolase (TIGR01450 family)
VIDLSRVRHAVLNMDGTLYCGTRLFAPTLPFLERLRSLGIGHRFLTNNTSCSMADHVAKLQKLGIEARETEIYTPAESTIAYLRSCLPRATALALLGTPSLVQKFVDAGFAVNWDAPDVVVVGFDITLTYERLCRAAYWISAGLAFLATHPDFVCPTDEPTVLVDCGSLCACLTAATGRHPTVFGKLNPSILLELCDRLHLAAEQMLMVGDRIYTDMKMAREAGVPGVLVLTGETTAAHAADLPHQPDLTVADIGQLGELLADARRVIAS